MCYKGQLAVTNLTVRIANYQISCHILIFITAQHCPAFIADLFMFANTVQLQHYLQSWLKFCMTTGLGKSGYTGNMFPEPE